MGRRLVHVPPNFEHPLDSGGAPLPGAHLELLYNAGETACTAYQIYEDVSEGTPVSPIFLTLDEMRDWLRDAGATQEAIESFVRHGSAPLLVVSRDGVRDGLTGRPGKTD
jgi:hypothetical protein